MCANISENEQGENAVILGFTNVPALSRYDDRTSNAFGFSWGES
jgi:hypothetical protein